MISVAEALERLFALVAPLEPETVPLRVAAGRVLAEDATALRDQPPFPASAMDGYAVRGDAVAPGARFTVIGEAPAGRRFAGRVGSGEAVRIFTGAPMP
ncbi:MAG: molybdopterin molybdenumtransferase MoeA, partial [Rhodosalinus sp.]